MTKTIIQDVVFKNARASDIYDLYVDAKKHTQSTGAPAKISAKVGSSFSAHDGFITGKNLQLVKDRLIIQSWRGKDWKKDDADSTFIISLEQKGKDTLLHAVHANIPDNQVKGISKGWKDFYWDPWKKFLAGKPAMQREKM